MCAFTVKVADHWQQLMLKMEDRLKLVNASVAFYKTSEQVSLCVTQFVQGMLDAIARAYLFHAHFLSEGAAEALACRVTFMGICALHDYLRYAVCWKAWSRSTSEKRIGVVVLINWAPTVSQIMSPPWSANIWSRKRLFSR